MQILRHGKVNVFDVARNMGTSVQIIESYYCKHATAQELATKFGGKRVGLNLPFRQLQLVACNLWLNHCCGWCWCAS